MPILSGGSGGGGAGAMTLLSTTTLGADNQFDVSGIAQTYNDLLLVMMFRSARAATADFCQMRVNNDATASAYETVNIDARTTVTASTVSATAGQVSDGMAGNSATAGFFSLGQMWIPGYTSTTWQKQFFYTWSGSGTNLNSVSGVMQWHNTAAINRVAFWANTIASPSNLLAGSSLRIYGVL